jgi:hypothetical protein
MVTLEIKKHLTTFLNYSFLALCITIATICYCSLLLSMSSMFDLATQNLINAVSFTTIMITYLFGVPILFVTIIFYGIEVYRKLKSKN